MTTELSPARRYRGAEAEERRAQRRGQLIAAAVQVYGERGYQNATVKAVCKAAGLTERYFYESFANSEALLLASFQTVTDLLLQKIELAGEAAGGVGSVPRRVEVLGHATHAQRPQCARGRRERATARCQPAQHGAVERASRARRRDARSQGSK